jgi:6-phosphofructokinase 1
MQTATKVKRVGILFSGGPAPAANAVIEAAAQNLLNAGVDVIGFLDGYAHLEAFSPDSPLREGKHYLRLDHDLVSGIRNRKAILIRTSRANPGKAVKSPRDLADPAKNARLLTVYQALTHLEIDGLVSIGGDDTLKTANFIYQIQQTVPGLRPIRVVHLPKTIDNDYFGIDWTFGFTSAANCAAMEIRNISADAKTTSAWWVLEIMGRKAGWLTYAAGIAGEAHRMISVEDVGDIFDIPVVAGEIVDLIAARAADGRDYGVVCVAEGLADRLADEFRPKEVDAHGNLMLGAAQVGRVLAEEIEKTHVARTGRKIKVRSKQIGYETRCTEPVAFDILLGAQLGVGAFRAMTELDISGQMVSVEKQLELIYVPFGDLIDPETLKTRVRFIRRESDFYKLARALEYQVRST